MRDMEYYETKKHEGPDYETFMKIANDVLWSAMRDYIDKDASVYSKDLETVAFLDIVKTIEEGRLVIYACIVKDEEQAKDIQNYTLINTLGIKDHEVDMAMTYVARFCILLQTTYLIYCCLGMADGYDPAKPETVGIYDEEEEYIVISKTPEEIKQIVMNNTGRAC